jgi:hypothetical protein
VTWQGIRFFSRTLRTPIETKEQPLHKKDRGLRGDPMGSSIARSTTSIKNQPTVDSCRLWYIYIKNSSKYIYKYKNILKDMWRIIYI